jgi:predicted nucleotidyltransferase
MNDRVQAATRKQVVDSLRGHHRDLARLHVKALALFGSLARDEARPESDIDLLVEFDGEPTFDRFMDLKFFLEDLLGRKVDLVTRAALKPRMRRIVEREAMHVA